jgi:pantothenate synthetase
MLPIEPKDHHKHKHQAIIFAGYLEGVRLIDNLVFEFA